MAGNLHDLFAALDDLGPAVEVVALGWVGGGGG
jgi:hypothetical protein